MRGYIKLKLQLNHNQNDITNNYKYIVLEGEENILILALTPYCPKYKLKSRMYLVEI